MFLEHKEAMEVTDAPAKFLKASDAMREGCRLTPAGSLYYSRAGRTCAICAAAVGAGYTYDMHVSDHGGGRPVYSYLYKAFPQVPRATWEEAEGRYNNGEATREQIADWLESQGY